MKADNLLIIQPLLASYRKDLFEDMTKYFKKVTVLANLKPINGFYSPEDTAFDKIHTPIVGKREKIYFQKNVITYILKNRPSIIFITHDFRSISFWIVLILSRILSIPIFGHGQGLYNKPNPSLIHRFIFKTSIKLLTKYICYTKSVLKSLENIKINKKKLSVMSNTIINNFPINPNNELRNKYKLFYLGRLREGNNLKLLLEVMNELKHDIEEITLDVIGDGEEKNKLMNIAKKYDLNVTFHGSIYSDEKISEISKNSTFGIYPGDAGLSIVHYMSLSLIPIIHDDLSKHMGPEPSYITNKFNGLTFKRNSTESLKNTLISILDKEEEQEYLSKNAFNTYINLTKIRMSEKLYNIIKGGN